MCEAKTKDATWRYVEELADKAQRAAQGLATIRTDLKDEALRRMADGLEESADAILQANERDMQQAKANGISGALLDRLTLNNKRISDMAEGLRAVAALPDPVGETVAMWRRPNGLEIGRVRVPLGVVGIIYEARPNVTADAAGLCLKAGNAVILRGGSEAIESNRAIVKVLQDALKATGLPVDSIQLIENTDRQAATALMQMRGLVDVLIPRGGAGLINAVVENAKVPVIETGVGNCHTYVDEQADLRMALEIADNAKTSRPAVCNAMETLLVHAAIAETFLPQLYEVLKAKAVEIRGCERTCAILSDVTRATDDDWATEYLDYILAVKVVDSLDEAIEHIRRYSTKHSEAIVTDSYERARRFLEEVDAAAVYVNASTRFTDGYEFGLGAEIGISTQKLHARGPMGLAELTTTKYVVYGSGQIRS